MIDPTTLSALASAAVAALMPLLQKAIDKGAEEVGKSAAGGLLDKLKSKFKGTSTEQSIDKLAQNPTRESARSMLQGQILEALEDDPAFAVELQGWLRDAGVTEAAIHQEAHASGGSTVVQVAGGQGNSVHIR